jgi:hypothetical protein
MWRSGPGACPSGAALRLVNGGLAERGGSGRVGGCTTWHEAITLDVRFIPLLGGARRIGVVNTLARPRAGATSVSGRRRW